MRSFAFSAITVALFSTASCAQLAPTLLRVDLLSHPERVYHQGLATSNTLDQPAANADLEFSAINSRFPAFSWAAPRGQLRQSAYQLLLSDNNAFAKAWNSGKVAGDNNTTIVYTGPALKPATVYYWKVRTWDGHGRTSRYSAAQSFRTAGTLLDYALPSFVLIKTPQFPVARRHVGANTLQVDFGRDGFAQLLLTVTSQNERDSLHIGLGEKLASTGRIDTRPPGTVRYRDMGLALQKGKHSYRVVIPADKRNTGENAIRMPAAIGEVMPFRLAEISSGSAVTIDSVSQLLVTAEVDDDAVTFSSSDSVLNTIWDLCKYTIKATSFTGYYVDGDRERIPYEADALVNQLSHYSTDAEFGTAKRTLDYLIYHPTWPTEWSLQNALIAWNDYRYSGDARNLRILYPQLKHKLLTALAREDGLISTRTGKQTPEVLAAIHYKPFNANPVLKDIVDWPQAGGFGAAGETDGFVFTDYNAVVNAYYYAGLRAMRSLASAVGEKHDAAFYDREALRVKAAYLRVFYDDGTGLVKDGETTGHSSLHANMFALAFGLVPDDKLARVVNFVRSRRMACSVYGAQFLLDALGAAGQADYALQLVTSTAKRSWIAMLREGATMTMEAWGQEYKPNQDWNHAWGTAPGNYVVRHLMGVQPTSPGFSTLQIRPQPGKLRHADLRYRTIKGDVGVRFVNGADTFMLDVDVPGNTTAQICVPAASATSRLSMDGRTAKATYRSGYWVINAVGAGTHHFAVSAHR